MKSKIVFLDFQIFSDVDVDMLLRYWGGDNYWYFMSNDYLRRINIFRKINRNNGWLSFIPPHILPNKFFCTLSSTI